VSKLLVETTSAPFETVITLNPEFAGEVKIMAFNTVDELERMVNEALFPLP